jgi:nicotine blue oxidoreductase
MIEAIVLAAGQGERLGRIKPLVPIDGVPALARVVQTVKAAGIERIIVVLGHAASEIQATVPLNGCRVVVNPHFEDGMASSLKTGIAALAKKADGFLILHADMPYLLPQTVRVVLAQAREGMKIVAPAFRGRRGFPVYLHATCLPKLVPILTGETGARQYIEEHRDDLVLVPVDDEGAVHDIDRVEDLRRKGGKR